MDAASATNVTPADDYAALVRDAAEGDPEAMERLLLRAQASAYRFSVMVCGRTDETEDVMQEALVSTYKHARAIRDPNAFKAWLYRTVRNACLLNRRRRVAEPAHLLSLDDAGPHDDARVLEPADTGENPEDALEAADRRAQLRKALLTLPGPQREVIVLRDLEGLSTREVAEVVQISEDNVKQRLHRARVALRAALEPTP
ncbi:RNA polymerase sigma factor [Luteitalea sp. TBR-22]|uniref:RNA polymerase sigma factor n=1 Tax=Luteitalea sp. TBR-22 TaxID=2802971 RepID=UPI001EF5EAB3|nr:sigma-70 family RNA polymerase sigma factor [Luteitalea sp. TBR-22]